MAAGMTELLKDFMSSTSKLIVDNPNDVNIEVTVSTKNVIVQISLKRPRLTPSDRLAGYHRARSRSRPGVHR